MNSKRPERGKLGRVIQNSRLPFSFSEVPTNYFLLSSPLSNGLVQQVALGMVSSGLHFFSLLAQEEVETGGGQFIVG